MCQVQAVVHAHTNKGHNPDSFYGPELVLHDSEKEAEKWTDFLGCGAAPLATPCSRNKSSFHVILSFSAAPSPKVLLRKGTKSRLGSQEAQ